MQKIMWKANQKYYYELMSNNAHKYNSNILKYYFLVILFASVFLSIMIGLENALNISDSILLLLTMPMTILIGVFIICPVMTVILHGHAIIVFLINLKNNFIKNTELKNKIGNCVSNTMDDFFYNVEIEFVNNSLKIHIMNNDYIVPYINIAEFKKKKKYVVIYFRDSSLLKIPQEAWNVSNEYVKYLNKWVSDITVNYMKSQKNVCYEKMLKTIDYKYKKFDDFMFLLSISFVATLNMYYIMNSVIEFPAILLISSIIIFVWLLTKNRYEKKWKDLLENRE